MFVVVRTASGEEENQSVVVAEGSEVCCGEKATVAEVVETKKMIEESHAIPVPHVGDCIGEDWGRQKRRKKRGNEMNSRY